MIFLKSPGSETLSSIKVVGWPAAGFGFPRAGHFPLLAGQTRPAFQDTIMVLILNGNSEQVAYMSMKNRSVLKMNLKFAIAFDSLNHWFFSTPFCTVMKPKQSE